MTPEEIRALRDRLGLTLEEFARLFGVTLGTAWKWDTGRSVPRRKAVRLLEIAVNLSREEVLNHLKQNQPFLPGASKASNK